MKKRKRRNKNFLKKYHYVYITTDAINGKQYVGDHSTDDLNDNYLGSGNLLINAIKIRGKNSFKKEILEYFNSRNEAFNAQKSYIKKYNTLHPNGYNLHKSGGRNPISQLSPELIQKYIDSLDEYYYSIEKITISITKDNFEQNREMLLEKIQKCNDRACFIKNNLIKH